MSRKCVLPATFYERPVTRVARELIGKYLFTRQGRTLVGGLIVETEAYLPIGDAACHAARRQTPKSSAMFGPPGTAYVYSIHAKYCFNVVAEPEGTAAAILIRAIEPRCGISLMRRRRKLDCLTALASGPAKLCQALGISAVHNGCNLTTGRIIWLEDHRETTASQCIAIKMTARIGVTAAKDLPLRCVWANHPFASGPKSLR